MNTALKLKNKKTMRQVIIFCVLMTLIWSGYFIVRGKISKYMDSHREYYSGNEFVQTIDCAPLIDANGTDSKYLIKFDLKTSIPGKIMVHFQNGYGARYSFFEEIDAGNEFQHYEIIIQPSELDKSLSEAYLSFHGSYGTGVIPTIKHVSCELYNENIDE